LTSFTKHTPSDVVAGIGCSHLPPNHRIVEYLMFLGETQTHSRMLEFGVGMLTRYNKKTLAIITDNGQRWNIAPGVLCMVPIGLFESGKLEPNVLELRKS